MKATSLIILAFPFQLKSSKLLNLPKCDVQLCGAAGSATVAAQLAATTQTRHGGGDQQTQRESAVLAGTLHTARPAVQ